MKRDRIGRPMKYDNLIRALDDNEIYTPATITQLALDYGFIENQDPARRRLEAQRIRIALGRFSNNHFFPDEGDGMVRIKGQSPTPGWYGWRWKEPLL